MNPLAQELNEQIQRNNPHVYEMLSSLGRRLFFPKGILSQSAEAKEKAYRFNATIGIALEKGESMHLACIRDMLRGVKPDDVFPYAPAAGKPALREKWREKQIEETPSLRDKKIGRPIATNALTHGITLAADLFVEEGDTVLLPDKFWGNYRMILEVRKQGRIVHYPFYDASGRFNVQGLQKAIEEQQAAGKDKLLVLLNFPNNPTGYSIDCREAEEVSRVLVDAARKGTRLIVILDEAYYGLFYSDDLFRESLLGKLANQDERLLVVKLDGATKEEFVWGFRVGFLTFGVGPRGDLATVYQALEKKTMGAIRGSISNSPHLTQTLVLKALESPDFRAQQAEKFALLKGRARKVMQVLKNPKYEQAWTLYPFNAGYFMCLAVKGVDGEQLRKHLLNTYGVGVIAVGGEDIRVAFSCIEEENVEELFELVYRGIMDLKT
jgi:aspartate/methionine/tyrosine aminotransferase